MRTVALALALCLLPLAAAADILVRAAEHVGFTRVVLAYRAAEGWEVVPVPGGWEFRANEPGVVFDLAAAFATAGRARLAELTSPQPSALFLRAACNCHARVWTFRGGKPVIDIHDGPARPMTADIAIPVAPGQGMVQPAAGAPQPEEARAGSGTAEGDDDATGLAAAVAGAARPAVALDALADEIDARRQAAEFETRLAREFGRAGSQDILEPPPAGSSRPAGGEGSDPPPGAAAPPWTGDHLRVETAIDRDRPGARDAAAGLTDEGHACPADGSLDPGEWGRMAGGTPDFAEGTAGITGELDQVDPGAALRAARFYLYLGFGAEARQMLLLAGDDRSGQDLLLALAEIMDHEGAAAVATALDGWESCDSAAALWSVLAGPPLRRGDPVDARAVVRAFLALPDHLRQLLGPRLAIALAGAGLDEPARRVGNAMSPAQGDPTPEAAIVASRLAEADGRPQEAESMLQAALEAADPESPEVLLALARQRIAEARVPSPEVLGALESFGFERRGDPLAAEIALVLVEAEILSRRYPAARDRLADLPPSPQASDLLRRLYHESAAHAGDAAFLRLVLPAPAGLGHGAVETPVRMAIAGRLLALGFPLDSLAILDGGTGLPEAGAEPAVRLLGARANLALGRPAAALAQLADIALPEALPLRAEAQELLGNLALARRTYAEAGLPDEVRRLDVLIRGWDALAAGTGAENPGVEGRGADPEGVDGPPRLAGPGPAPEAAGAPPAAVRLPGQAVAADGDLPPVAPALPVAGPDDPHAAAEALIRDSAAERALIAQLLAE